MNKLTPIVDYLALRLDKSSDYGFRETLAYSVKHWRATLIKRDLERNVLDARLLQTICIPLEYGSTSVCCSVVTGCKGLMSTVELPVAVRSKIAAPFYGLTTLKYTAIDYKIRQFWKESEVAKYTKNNLLYDVINNKLYVKNAKNLTHVYITDIWEDPELLTFCNDNAVNNCGDYEFPIADDMITTIIEGIISLDLKLINKDNQQVEITEQ